MTTENQTQLQCGACPGCEGVCRLKAENPPALGGEPAAWCAPVPLAGCSKPYDQGFADGCAESQRLNEPTVARLQAAFEVVCNLAHARADELEQLRAEVERQSAERQTYVESTQRACKIIGQLRGLLREVLVYDKSQRLGDGFNLSGLLQRIDAALAGGKEHE